MKKPHNSVEESQQNDFDDVSSLFEDTECNIGGKYDETVTSVIEISKDHLEKQNETKNKLRTPFTWFFCVFLSIEYIGLIVLIILNACIKNFTVSEYVLVTYISSVFLETLGVILFMIKFAYNNKTELKILEILQSIVNNYKK